MTIEEVEEAQYNARVIFEHLTVAMHEGNHQERVKKIDFAKRSIVDLIESLHANSEDAMAKAEYQIDPARKERIEAVQCALKQLQQDAMGANAPMLAYLIQMAFVETEDILEGRRQLTGGSALQ